MKNYVYTNLNVPVAPREPFQYALLTELFELRHETPVLPPLFKLPNTHGERTPEAAGLQLNPAPKRRITLYIISFANTIIN